MTSTRVAFFIALTLAAATLPVTAQPLATRSTDQSKTAPAPQPPDQKTQHSSTTRVIAANADVWDGGSARAHCPAGGPTFVFLAAQHETDLLPLTYPRPCGQALPSLATSGTDLCRLICRLPNAPPVF